MQIQDVTHRPASPLAGLESPTERVIVPAKRRLVLRDLPREGPVIRVLAARDFKVKYKQSLFGPLWLVFQPLALLAAFLIAFRHTTAAHSSGVPYVVFALTGLSVWTYFQASMTIGTASVVSNYGLVRFTSCPRPAFPIAALIASLPSFAVTAFAAIIGAAASGDLATRALLLPVVLCWLLVLTAGVVGLSSALTVRYRDIASGLPFLLQVGVFLAPIGYSFSAVSPTVRTLVELNPLTGIIEMSRWVLLVSYHPSVTPIVISVALTIVLGAVGWRVFSRFETTMADEA